jgi:tricarballylate dehydrogenase
VSLVRRPGDPPLDGRLLTATDTTASVPGTSSAPLLDVRVPIWTQVPWDVVVVGGGNAGIVAALTANDHGARVLLVESAPRHMRGGNTRHTRNIRCVHAKADDYNSGAYEFPEFWDDLSSVGSGPNDEQLAMLTVRESETIPAWMAAHGVRWQLPLAGTLHLGRTNRFFLGGGKALLNSYYRNADARPSVEVAYDARVEAFNFHGDRCEAVVVRVGDRTYPVRASAIVCASGGYESNLEWLRLSWGAAVDNYIIRGTPYNDGGVLALLYDAGAAAAGNEKGFHAIAVDARAPRYDGGIATRLDAIPFGIVVNSGGERFNDEGADLWPKRYAMWGTYIAQQPDQIAYSIWDSKVRGLFLPPMYGADESADIASLARHYGLEAATLSRTVDEFNCAVVSGRFDPGSLDECRTRGLAIQKSHWAQRIDRPPYYSIPVRPGITFTYRGVQVGADGRVVRQDGTSFSNVFAAGEIMSGNILSSGYLAGFGMTIGSVWGRLSGAAAVAVR